MVYTRQGICNDQNRLSDNKMENVMYIVCIYGTSKRNYLWNSMRPNETVLQIYVLKFAKPVNSYTLQIVNKNRVFDVIFD